MELRSSPTPHTPQSPQHSEALTQRMKGDTCFRCENKGHWARDCPMELRNSPTHHTPQSPEHSEALTQRMKGDTCFRCKNKGHWSRDCPLGSPGSSPSKAKPSSSSVSSDVPVMHCTCGAACVVRTASASNPKNPNRKYYFCRGNCQDGNGCGFVEWCDNFTARQCPCRAGTCRIYAEKEESGGRWKKFSYGCRVRKGFGACSFLQKIGEEGPVTGQPQASKMEIEPPALDNPDNSVDLADVTRDEDIEQLLQYGSKKLDEVVPRLSGPELSSDIDLQEMVIEERSGATNHDSGVEDIALLDHISQTEIATPSMMSQVSEIRSLQEDFMKQISAVGDGLTQVTFNLILARQVMGWCGRIVFQPSRWMPEPQPRPFFCCIFPSLGAMMESGNVEVIANRGRGLLSHIPLRPGLNGRLSRSLLPLDPLSPPNTNEQPMQLLAWLADSLNGGNINQPSNFGTGGGYAELLQRTAAGVQNEFIALLDRISPLDLELLLNEAVVCFKTLCLLGTADCSEFIRCVMRYLECASSLARIESSHGPDPSSQLQELRNQHEVKRKRYEDMSQLHSEKMSAYGASQGRLEALSKNAARLRDMLSQVEKEIAECQDESCELEICLVDVNQEVKLSRRSMEAVAQELGEARDKEMKRAAAVDALEKARSQLRQ